MGLGLKDQKAAWRGPTTPWEICQPISWTRKTETFLLFFSRSVWRAKHWRLNHGVYEEAWMETSAQNIKDNSFD